MLLKNSPDFGGVFLKIILQKGFLQKGLKTWKNAFLQKLSTTFSGETNCLDENCGIKIVYR